MIDSETGGSTTKILISDQLNEMDTLIGILSENVKGLSNALKGVLVEEVSATEAEGLRSDSVELELAPVQVRLMSQYNEINHLISELSSMTHRVRV